MLWIWNHSEDVKWLENSTNDNSEDSLSMDIFWNFEFPRLLDSPSYNKKKEIKNGWRMFSSSNQLNRDYDAFLVRNRLKIFRWTNGKFVVIHNKAEE